MPKLPDKLYNWLKWGIMTVVPFLSWGYVELGKVWGWAYLDEISQTTKIITFVIGGIIGFCSWDYWKNNKVVPIETEEEMYEDENSEQID